MNRLGLKSWIGIGLAVLAIIVGTIYHLHQSGMSARLMQANPDSIPDNPALLKFALAAARPAYEQHCASCHGAQLQGDSIKGASNLADRDWLYGDGRVANIERTILYGIRAGNAKTKNLADMPAFAQAIPYARYDVTPLDPRDIRDVVEYLRVSGGKTGDAVAAERGAKVFSGKGQCFDCHAEDMKGDNSIGAPNLVDDVWLYGSGTPEDIYNSIAHGRSGVCPVWIQQLSPVTIRALAVFIYVASHS